jgi:hypothetical protein
MEGVNLQCRSLEKTGMSVIKNKLEQAYRKGENINGGNKLAGFLGKHTSRLKIRWNKNTGKVLAQVTTVQ